MDFVLGTAQLDTSKIKRYGTCNQSKLSDDDVQEILEEADNQNIKRLDTASGYGNNYQHLYNFYRNDIRIIQIGSKIESQNWITKETSIEAIKDNYKIEHRMVKDTQYLELLSFHNFEDYEKQNAYQALIQLKNENYVSKIGVSIYYYWQCVKVIGDPNIDYLQIPFNILTNFDLEELVNDRNNKYPNNSIIIDVRSIVLQGLLLNLDYKYWSVIPDLDYNTFLKLKQIIENMCNDIIGDVNSDNLLLLYIGYLKSFNWINGIVFGIDNIIQLKNNIEIFNKAKPIDKNKINIFRKSILDIVKIIPNILDPTKWNKK
jgi:aryl-alcohol dehydrogenase-like predicted oxidoreductase